MAKKKEVFPYKYLRPHQVEEIREMKMDELIKEHIKENKNIKVLKKQKKEHDEIIDLSKQIKKHRENHELADKIKEMKNEIKELRKTIDLEIEDVLLDKKELVGGFNDSIKSHQERMDVVFKFIDERGKTLK